MKTLQLLYKYVIEKKRIIGIVCANIAYVFFGLLSPLIIGFVVDNVLGNADITNPLIKIIALCLGGVNYVKEHMWLAAVLLAIVACICFIIQRMNMIMSKKLAEDNTLHLKQQMFLHYEKVPYSYHVEANSGDLLQRATTDIEKVGTFIGSQLGNFVRIMTRLIMTSIILFSINWKLALIATFLLPMILVISIIYRNFNEKQFDKLEKSESELNMIVEENASGVRVVKAFDKERDEITKFEKKSSEYASQNARIGIYTGSYWAISSFICNMVFIIVLAMGAYFSIQGELSLGNFFIFSSYIDMLVWPIRELGRIIADLSKVKVSLKRIDEVMCVTCEDYEQGEDISLHGNISFSNVYFQYDDKTQVLKGVNFDVNEGETIAIMGPTGSGKSSLIHLLSRLYDYSGSILLDGKELKEINRSSLRKQVGLVLQEPYLFSRSVIENLKIARRDANDNDVYQACQIASADDFIRQFDQGYQTEVGEKGVKLSGGQKQRIAIARTIINECPILIFDDSLSALDSDTDLAIRNSLQHLPKKPTTFIITHRVNSAKEADKIIVLENGIVSQMGTHDTLIEQDGLYARIAKIQMSQEIA